MAREIPEYDFVWQQGEDGEISAVYRRDGVAVNLTGWKLRMDVRSPTGTLLFTFNNTDITDTTQGVDNVGVADNEATLGADGTIYVVVPRATSLGEGPLVPYVNQPLPYDIFLRDNNDLQKKILKGLITIEASQTRWN